VSRWWGRLLSGERLRVELRPASVSLMRRGLLPRSRMHSSREVEAALSGPENSSEFWRAAVDTLSAALRDSRARVEIVLSDHFVRYLLIPWSGELVGDAERLGFARMAFRDLYGPLADSWDLCLDEQPAGQASFACAVDRALVSSLRDLVERAGGQLITVIPSLADCINRHRSALSARDFCLVAAEFGRVSLAFHSRTGWQAVRSRRIDGPLAETLPTLLKQEMAVGDVTESGTLYVCTDEAPPMVPFAVPGWRVTRLPERGVSKTTRREPQMVVAGG
jgi:hypothetical protein